MNSRDLKGTLDGEVARRTLGRILGVVVALGALAPVGLAEEPAAPPKTMAEFPPGHLYTLEELTKIGLANQPRLKAAAEDERAARARKGEALAPYYPTVNAYGEYVRATYNNSVSTYMGVPGLPSIGGYASVDAPLVPGGQVLAAGTKVPLSGGSNDNYMASISLNWDLYDFGRRESGVHLANAGIDLARSAQAVVAEAVVYQVRQAYYGLLGANALNLTSEKMLAEANEHLTWAHEAVKDGLRPPVDEFQAKADVTKAELALVQTEAGVRVARVRLLEAIGEEHIRHLEVANTSVPADLGETEETLLDRAFGQRPDYKAITAKQHEAEATKERFKAGFLPYLNAVGGAFVTGADPGLPSTLSVVPNWDLGLVLTVPIFEGYLTTHQVEEAEARVAMAKDEEENLKLVILEQVREAFVNFKASLEAVAAADANQRAAEEELHVIEGRYNNGLGSILDLVIAQATAVTAEDQAVRARYQAGVARSFVDLAIGTPAP